MQLGVAHIDGLQSVGDVVLKLSSVGDVQIHVEHRIPLAEQSQHGLHLGGIRFGVVAVEVVVLGGGAPAHLFGTGLIRAVPPAEALVAVHVEYRDEHQDEGLERARRGLVVQELAYREEAGVLAIDLAGVDAALHQQHREAALAGLRRRQHSRAGNDQRKQRPALGRTAKLHTTHGVLPVVLVSRAQPLDFVVAAGPLKLRSLGYCLQVIGRVQCKRCRQAKQRESAREDCHGRA